MDNSQSSIFKRQDYSNLQYSFHLLEQLVEAIERIFKTFNRSTILHVEFVSRCIRNCSDDADGISKVMFSGDGREELDLQIRGRQFFDIVPRNSLVTPLTLWPASPARPADPNPSFL